MERMGRSGRCCGIHSSNTSNDTKLNTLLAVLTPAAHDTDLLSQVL